MKRKEYLKIFLAITGYCMLSCSSNENKTTSQAESPPSLHNTVDSGKMIFEGKCAICHGLDGTAGIANASNLQTSRLDSVSTVRIIAEGKNAMPAFKKQLNTEETDMLINYVFTLRK